MILRIFCLLGVSILAGIVPCFTRICSLIGCLTLSLLIFYITAVVRDIRLAMV